MKKIAIAFIPLLFIACSGEERKSVSPEKKDITESVYSSATVQPDSMYNVFSSVTGIMDESFVHEGDQVVVGQKLFQITNNNPKLNTENARLAMQIAEDNYEGDNPVLTDMLNEVKLAQLKLTNDSMNYQRQKSLWKDKIGSKAEYDAKKLQYETSKHTLEALQNKFERTSVQLRQQYQQAVNNYEASLTLTEDFTIESKIKGTVYAVHKNPGEIISAQQPIAMVGSSTYFVLELLVDEVDVVKLSLSQEALITLDAYKNKVFKAKVTKIYPQKNERSQTFKIEAVFIDAPDQLYPGLSGEANILISEKKGALVIPNVCLLEGNQVETTNGMVQVKIGLENLEFVEILEGLTTSDQVLYPED